MCCVRTCVCMWREFPKCLFFFLPIKKESAHSVASALKCLQNVLTLSHSLTQAGSGKKEKIVPMRGEHVLGAWVYGVAEFQPAVGGSHGELWTPRGAVMARYELAAAF